MCNGTKARTYFPDLHSLFQLHQINKPFSSFRGNKKVLSEFLGHGQAFLVQYSFDFFWAVIVEIPHTLIIIHLDIKGKALVTKRMYSVENNMGQ